MFTEMCVHLLILASQTQKYKNLVEIPRYFMK